MDQPSYFEQTEPYRKAVGEAASRLFTRLEELRSPKARVDGSYFQIQIGAEKFRIAIERITALVLVCLLGVTACDFPTAQERNEIATTGELAKLPRIRYFRDPRTSLCFAYFFQRQGGGTTAVGGPALASVPCVPVQHLLLNNDVRKFDGEM